MMRRKFVPLAASILFITITTAAAFAEDSTSVVPLYDHKYLRYAGAPAATGGRSPTLTRQYVRENPKPKMLLLLPLHFLSQYSCRGCNAPKPTATPVLYGEQFEAKMSTYSPD